MSFKKIKNIKAAFKALGLNIENPPAFLDYPEKIRDQKLKEYILETGIEAINGPDWDSKYDDPNVPKWYIWWRVVNDEKRASGRGLRFYGVLYGLDYAAVGPRLTFESREKALHASKVLHSEFEAVYLR